MASGRSAVSLVVDLDALTALRDYLGRLTPDLSACVRGNTYADLAVTGDMDVSAAVDSFIGNWRDGRDKIGQKIDQCVALVEFAIQTYRSAEQMMTNAVEGGRATP